jgi:hypothetical protein
LNACCTLQGQCRHTQHIYKAFSACHAGFACRTALGFTCFALQCCLASIINKPTAQNYAPPLWRLPIAQNCANSVQVCRLSLRRHVHARARTDPFAVPELPPLAVAATAAASQVQGCS